MVSGVTGMVTGMVTGVVTGAWLDGSVDGHWAVTANFWCGGRHCPERIISVGAATASSASVEAGAPAKLYPPPMYRRGAARPHWGRPVVYHSWLNRAVQTRMDISADVAECPRLVES